MDTKTTNTVVTERQEIQEKVRDYVMKLSGTGIRVVVGRILTRQKM